MAIHTVGAELIHAERWTDWHDKASRHFLAKKTHPKNDHIVETVRDPKRQFVGKVDKSQKRTDESVQDNKVISN